ncbi:hypothetical protein GCM10023194_47680 [Planotetraspora phitsanulokensis]|uniref:HEAT repeat protein n=1 Tax=Planotetraspora phitsanulokensis TaxID=575192 RepID=A0A8J3XIT4_9ACTN|nr:hypothetical protein [Planotetraspora phitsanulokensis]GII43492.1 hypothetical protein Pph01_84950 [Planotetraspora phitsanulokensis]
MTASALDGIDDIDWASLGHAYGSAADVPQTLRDAVGQDEELAGEATEHLFGSIYHQGTLYSATPWAVPFVARLAADPGTRRREGLVFLLGSIAATGDADPHVLADVRTALARETRRLLPLLDDPDVEIRHVATYLLGNLPPESAAEVVPALRARRGRERSPRVLAGLLAAAGRLDPPNTAAWLAAELEPGRPAAVRAGALWAIADAALPWSGAAAEAVVDCWLNGEPLKNWVWSDDTFGDIVSRIDTASFAELCHALFERGTAEAARAVIQTTYERCVRSRSARAESAPLLAAGIDHPDFSVRVAAATAIQDVPAAAPAAADALAAYVADPPPAAVEDVNSNEARLFGSGLEILIALGDPRWREPLTTALTAGRIAPDVLGLLIDTGVTCDPDLLTAVRRRLAALPQEQPEQSGGYDALLARNRWHNEGNALTRMLRHWGPDAADAVPELIPLIPYDQWWTVQALAAIGPAAAAAVPALTRVRDDPEASWPRRLQCAEALAAVTGDIGHVSACVAEAAAGGRPVAAARTALRHGLPLDGLLPALRDIAVTAGGDDASAIGVRIEAAWLLLDAGETHAPLRAAADALDSGRHVADAAKLAGLIGPAAADLVPRLRDLLDDRHHFADAALAIRRVTGEAAPLVDAVRRRLARVGAGKWLVESLRELGADAAPLLPELRELAHGDAAIQGTGVYGRQARRDDEERRQLLAVLAELGN